MLKPLSTSAAHTAYEHYQQAAAPAARQAWLTELLAAHAAPLIQVILKQKLWGQASTDDLLEVQQQIHAKLLARLRATAESPLEDFPGYVAVVAFNTCAEWQRQRQPQRHALKNRVRYLLTHTGGWALWEARPRVWWCGRSAWQTRPSTAATTAQLDACRAALPRTRTLRDLTAAVFAQLNQPVELDELVNLFAEVLEIHDEPAAAKTVDSLADPCPSAETAFERRAYLQTLWAEIGLLPLPQRRALLLNLRDPEGGNQLALFHLTGIAGLRTLAAVLELSLAELVELWNHLPLDDLTLAAHLGITRQQVINLRLAARRRLARRLGEP
ncbi:MAG: hypothetical protein HYR56_03175 [Acidobacteria bacterium]|nr:hypothetical protein [Acidobacteriota bacterium]MBI3422027.1 hypothetical protein [Acidobacteriota bacterium]